MKVSIVIPVYNVEAYIGECVASVMAQTYHGIECILVDDCSPDNSMKIAREMIAAYAGPVEFRLLRHERNRGLSAARNTGTDAATGGYVYYLDSDDYITPDCIEKLAALALRYPGVDMVRGNTAVTDPDYPGWMDLNRGGIPEYIEENRQIRSSARVFHYLVWQVCNCLCRVDWLRQSGVTFAEGLWFEDVLWLRQLTPLIRSVAFCKDHTYIYRIQGGSFMAGSPKKRLMQSAGKVLRIIVDAAAGMTPWEKKHYFDLLASYYLVAKSKDNDEPQWSEFYDKLIADFAARYSFSLFRARIDLRALRLLPGFSKRILHRMLKYAVMGKKAHVLYRQTAAGL